MIESLPSHFLPSQSQHDIMIGRIAVALLVRWTILGLFIVKNSLTK